MIGGIGLMNWLLAWQVSRIVAITSSTCASSTPARIVAWDCFRKPPCECSRVTRKSLSVSASTRAPASSGWTIATTSFIGRRLYPAPLERPFDGQPRLVISGDAGMFPLGDHPLTLRPAASVARPGGPEADLPGGGCPRPPSPWDGRRRSPRSGRARPRQGGGIRRGRARRKRGRPHGSGPSAPAPTVLQGEKSSRRRER